MLSDKENIKLKSLGIHLTQKEILCYKKGDAKVLLHQLKQTDVLTISLTKTKKRERSFKEWFGLSREETMHADCIYMLEFNLKNNQKKWVNLANIDVITTQRIIKKLNAQFSHAS